MGDPAWSKTLNTFKAAFEEEPEKVTSDQRRVTSGRDSDLLVERLMWVSRMRTVALSIGDEKTRSEMLEYLCKKIEDGNNDPKDSLGDEVLTAIAEVLGGFEDFVGGPKEAHCLLKPLELLCQVDETTVRNQAVLAINQLAKQLTADQCAADGCRWLLMASDGSTPPTSALPMAADGCRWLLMPSDGSSPPTSALLMAADGC